MTQPDVALTDFVLVIEGIVFALLLCRRGMDARRLRSWLTLFFASVSAASLCGGLVHGFFLDEQSLGAKILWPMTLLATGVTALSLWAIGAKLLFSSRTARWVIAAATLEFACFACMVLFQTDAFWLAWFENLPPVFFLILAIGVEYRRVGLRNLWLAAAGLALTVVAAALQQSKVGLHPVYFNHNALYHVLQAIALFLLFLGVRSLAEPGKALPGADRIEIKSNVTAKQSPHR